MAREILAHAGPGNELLNGLRDIVTALLDALDQAEAEVERLRGPFPCCEHCTDDPGYHAENPRDSHTTSCTRCDRRANAAEARLAAVRALREIEDELARARARMRLSDPERARVSHWTAGHRPHHRIPD